MRSFRSQNRSNQPQAITVTNQNGHVVELESIPSEDLIGPEIWRFSRDTVFADGRASISLHVTGGATSIGGGAFGAQTIQSLPISTSFQDFLIQSIQRLDAIVDADFSISTDSSHREINFYLDQEINLDSSGGTALGIALSNYDHIQGGWWEAILNAPGFQGNTAYMQYASLHELGHTFGLEHPFEASDGDVYRSTDPYNSAYPEQTVMAYRSPLSGAWPTWYSNSDLEALITNLGAETQFLTATDDYIIGKNYTEKIHGRSGNDTIIGGWGNDEIRGGSGDDLINGNQGSDLVIGGEGNDKLYGGLGPDLIHGNRGNDVIRGGNGHDTLNGGEGDDILTGNKGIDLFILSVGLDIVTDFDLSLDQIGLDQNLDYSVGYLEHSTLINSGIGTLSLENILLNEAQVSRLIRYV